MTLIARLRRSFSLVALVNAQQQLITDQMHEIRRLRLDHLREMQGLVAGWRIHMETPEIDLRDDVDKLMTELTNQAAILEEHVL